MIEYQGFAIKPAKIVSTSYEVYVPGRGGKLPKALEGLFTSVGVAKTSIDKYLQVGTHAKAINKS
jgi:hypothetical protein